jgi:uncharacterized protein
MQTTDPTRVNGPSTLERPPEARPAPRDERTAEPVAKQGRIEDIDVIRGCALFGVLLMNLVIAFRVPFWGDAPRGATQGVDHAIMTLENVLLSGKAMTLFSILFGAGLSIFFERASARHPHPMRLLVRRLFVLLAFGLAHLTLVWDGDILVSYTLAGFVALCFLRARPALLVVAAVVCFALPVVGQMVPAIKAITAGARAPGSYERAFHAYSTGRYLDVVRFRALEVVPLLPRGYLLFWPHELKNMLIGIWVWRSGVLREPLAHLRLLRWAALGGIVLGASFPLFMTIRFELYHPPPSPPSTLRFALSSASMFLLALGYGAGLLLLLRRERWRARLVAFAPLGRMAFTNYLTQSIAFSTLFYGYGFGLLGKIGVAAASALGVGFYALQAVTSAAWLRRFSFGPFEWAWRCLTYGRLQPLRRVAAVSGSRRGRLA